MPLPTSPQLLDDPLEDLLLHPPDASDAHWSGREQEHEAGFAGVSVEQALERLDRPKVCEISGAGGVRHEGSAATRNACTARLSGFILDTIPT